MKVKRQAAILNIIKEKYVKTQEDLSSELIKMGFDVTQATVSRDIKELRLLKKQTGDGGYRYIKPENDNVPETTSRIRSIFSNSVISIDYSMNNIVIKTLSGMAQAAAITLEAMEWPEILGTIGGDDTVLVVLHDENSAKLVAKRLKTFII